MTTHASYVSRALAPLGVEVDELPITRERLLEKIARHKMTTPRPTTQERSRRSASR